MKLGNMATVGAYGPRNLVHVILDNGVHDSTGGQPTASATTDFLVVAQGCGYHSASRVNDVDTLASALSRALASRGPHLIHARICSGSMNALGRPTLTPDRVARRLREFLA
jgi:phosphonopyruvate decarboxylase